MHDTSSDRPCPGQGIFQGVDGKARKCTTACLEFRCLPRRTFEHGEVGGPEFRDVVNRPVLVTLGLQLQPDCFVEPDDSGHSVAKENQCTNVSDHRLTHRSPHGYVPELRTAAWNRLALRMADRRVKDEFGGPLGEEGLGLYVPRIITALPPATPRKNARFHVAA